MTARRGTSVREPNKFGAARPEELAAFEAQQQVELPPDYRQFILDNNGGRPQKNIHPALQTDVNWLFGFNRKPDWASIYWNIETYEGRLPERTLPLGCDSGGNLYLQRLDREHYGAIVFWDHEREAEAGGGARIAGMPVVADGFSAFLDQLTE